MKIPDDELYTQIDCNGNIEYFADKKFTFFHRDFGPSFIDNDGFGVWFHHGVTHRTNGICYRILHGKIKIYHILSTDYSKTKYMSIIL